MNTPRCHADIVYFESPPRHYHLQQFHPRSAAADVLPAAQQAIQQCSSCRRIISQQQSANTALTTFMLVSLEACNFLEHHQSYMQTSHPGSAAAVSLLTFEQARQQVCSCRRSTVAYNAFANTAFITFIKTRLGCNSQDELLANFAGRISCNLRLNKMIPLIADRNTSEAASSSDQQLP